LLTEDGKLAEAAESCVSEIPNASVIRGIEGLNGLINILTSEVKEDLIAKIKEKVTMLFFTRDSQDGLYFKEKIRDRIQTEFAEQLSDKPSDEVVRRNGTWYIYPPQFFKKNGQRISWRTRIKVEAKLYQPASLDAFDLSSLFQSSPPTQPPALGSLVPTKSETLIKDGTVTFEVLWSVLVQTNFKLRSPRIDSTLYIETDWEKKAG
jgi:hypothetical protein